MSIVAQSLTLPAVSDYAWLQTEVADWLHRDDLAGKIPTFINLAEREINRRLKISAKETSAALAAVPGTRFVDLPADFGSPIALFVGSPRLELVPVTVPQLLVDEDLSKMPRYWAIDGNRIAFGVKPDQAYPLELRYIKAIFLSAAAPTNDLFARAPDLFLYGALTHAAPYMVKDDRLPMWQSKFEALLRSVAAEGARTIGMVPLQTELPGAMYRSASTRFWGL